MRGERQAVQDARRRIKQASTHMLLMNERAGGAGLFLPALAMMLDYTANVRHRGQGHFPRGILGGWSVQCSCGSSWVEATDGETSLCGSMERALAVAEAYMPNPELIDHSTPTPGGTNG